MTQSSPPPVSRNSATAAQSDRPLLRIAGLSKGYREGGGYHLILSNADASLRMGEFVALLGPSGSGKSTLLNLVSGIDAPDAGEVVVDGVSITGMTERERTLFRRHQIGFVFQFFNLIPTLTIEENLLLPLELKGRLGAEERRKARSLLEEVGLGGRESTYPDRLSGGEQQRVAVARALVHDPILVLADEPTGNLDAATGEKILDLLVSMVSSAGKTLFVVTHSRDVAARADRVFRIQGGLLVEDPKSGDSAQAP